LNRRKLTERADFLDCFRYFVNAILKRYLWAYAPLVSMQAL
jgi:hypothetical protein